MSTANSRYDFVPYPWPVKPALLFLLGLPENATKQEYEARWNEAMAGANEWPKCLFLKEVEKLQSNGRSYQDAWNEAKGSSRGQRLYTSWQQKTEVGSRANGKQRE